MGYLTNGLTFNALRGANIARLPQFKNKQGGLAHSKPDGSDWTVAQWFQATLGELGEFAYLRLRYEVGVFEGRISREEYEAAAPKELADTQTYLDILARRALDVTAEVSEELDHAQALMWAVAMLGEYGNARKKLDRGDIDVEQFKKVASAFLAKAGEAVETLLDDLSEPTLSASNPTIEAHPHGVDLGRATIDKFNEVTERVGSNVCLEPDDWHYVGEQR